MSDLLSDVTTWGVGGLIAVALIFGFMPAFVIEVLIRLYPSWHPRRSELSAELQEVPRRERLIWVAEQLATVSFDAIPARFHQLRFFRANRKYCQLRSASELTFQAGGLVPSQGVWIRGKSIEYDEISIERDESPRLSPKVVRVKSDGARLSPALDLFYEFNFTIVTLKVKNGGKVHFLTPPPETVRLKVKFLFQRAQIRLMVLFDQEKQSFMATTTMSQPGVTFIYDPCSSRPSK